MPYVGIHAARFYPPEECSDFEFSWDDGMRMAFVHAKREGKDVIQGARFEAQAWSKDDAMRFMSSKGMTPVRFDEALPAKVYGIADFEMMYPGTFDADPSEITIGPVDVDSSLRFMEMFDAFGVQPDFKYTHDKGSAAIGAGVLTRFWKEDGDRLFTRAFITDQGVAQEVRDGKLRNASVELTRREEGYDGIEYPTATRALAILPAGQPPAVPGAGVVRVVAQKGGPTMAGDEKKVVRFQHTLANGTPVEPGGTVPQSEDRTLEAINGLTARFDKLLQLLEAGGVKLAAQPGQPDAEAGKTTTTITQTSEGPDPVQVAAPAVTPEQERECSALFRKMRSATSMQITEGQEVDLRKALAPVDGATRVAVLSALHTLARPVTLKGETLEMGKGEETETDLDKATREWGGMTRAYLKEHADAGLSYIEASQIVLEKTPGLRDRLVKKQQ